MEITKNKLRVFHVLGREYLLRATVTVAGTTSKVKLNVQQPITKLHYAINKVLSRTKAQHTEFLEAMEELKISKYASVDNEGYLVKDAAGKFKMKPEKEVEFRKAIKKMGEEKIEIEPYIVEEYDVLLFERNFDMREAFGGIVIPLPVLETASSSN